MCILYLLYNYPLVYYKVQRSTNFKIIILKFFLLSVAFEWNVNHFAPHMGNNCYRNHKKNCIILESNWECAHGLIDITVVHNKNVLVNNWWLLMHFIQRIYQLQRFRLVKCIQTNEGEVYNRIVYSVWETFDTIYCYTYFSISFNWDESAKHPMKLKKSF